MIFTKSPRINSAPLHDVDKAVTSKPEAFAGADFVDNLIVMTQAAYDALSTAEKEQITVLIQE